MQVTHQVRLAMRRNSTPSAQIQAAEPTLLCSTNSLREARQLPRQCDSIPIRLSPFSHRLAPVRTETQKHHVALATPFVVTCVSERELCRTDICGRLPTSLAFPRWPHDGKPCLFTDG